MDVVKNLKAFTSRWGLYNASSRKLVMSSGPQPTCLQVLSPSCFSRSWMDLCQSQQALAHLPSPVTHIGVWIPWRRNQSDRVGGKGACVSCTSLKMAGSGAVGVQDGVRASWMASLHLCSWSDHGWHATGRKSEVSRQKQPQLAAWLVTFLSTKHPIGTFLFLTPAL